MIIIKKFFNFYISSSIHVALAVFALSWITLLELKVEFNKELLYFIFYAAISGYNFVKFFGVVKFKHRELAVWLKLIQLISFVCFLFMCFYAMSLKIKTLMVVSGFAVLTFLYAIPLFYEKTKSLRHIEGLKVYIIALVWMGVTVLLPVINEEVVVNLNIVLMAIQRFVLVLVLMIPFEIRDLKYDTLKLKTIPQNFGIKKTKFLGVFLLGIIFLLELFKENTSSLECLILVIMLVVTGAFVVNSKVNQSKYYSSFFVEALPVFWLMLMLVFF